MASSTDRDPINALHPEMREALEKRPQPDLSDGNANALQDGTLRTNRAAHLAKLRHLYPIPGPIPDEVNESSHHVRARDGYDIPVKIYIPIKRPASGGPVIIMFHEGGWSMGDLSDEDQNCRLFSRDLGAVCVNVDYRLAPEFPFPQGVEDAYDVVRWCTMTASPDSSILPGDLSQGFIVGGASAGGNLSAVVCQIARDEGLSPPLTGQYLCVPALLAADVVPEKWKHEYRSRSGAKTDPVLRFNEGLENVLLKTLKPDPASPLFSPLLHPNLRDLPPAFFQLGGLDPLRDEGLLYERVLREENGVPTLLNVYEGFGHMFWTNWPTMQKSHDFVNDTRDGVAWLLEVGKAKR